MDPWNWSLSIEDTRKTVTNLLIELVLSQVFRLKGKYLCPSVGCTCSDRQLEVGSVLSVTFTTDTLWMQTGCQGRKEVSPIAVH